jgi:hypothetical protein
VKLFDSPCSDPSLPHEAAFVSLPSTTEHGWNTMSSLLHSIKWLPLRNGRRKSYILLDSSIPKSLSPLLLGRWFQLEKLNSSTTDLV